jgi:hypothetical protein
MRFALVPVFVLLAGATDAASAQPSALSVTLSSAAFELPPAVGEVVRLEASASGGAPPYTFAWDLDGDGVIDRRSAAAAIEATFPRGGSLAVSVSVSDADGLSGSQARQLYLRAPRLLLEPVQYFGPDQLDPGDRSLAQTFRATNVGDATQPPGHAMFVPASIETSTGPSASGYLAVSSESGLCEYAWIDLVNGPHATPALLTAVADGNALGPRNDARTAPLTLPGGIRLYDQTYGQAVMSTNGYLSLDSRDSGADFSPRCGGGFAEGSFGPQLRPLHDDLIISGSGDEPLADAGLRYRHFENCPRLADDGEDYPCHVFSWIGMQRWNSDPLRASFDFQAIVYVGRHEVAYQYQSPPPNSGATATIGIANRDGSEAYNSTCATPSVTQAETATCIYRATSSPTHRPAAVVWQSVVPVPALAIGESAQLMVGFNIARAARCGQAVEMDYLGTAWDGGQTVEPTRVLEKRVAEQCSPPPGPGPIITPPPGQQAIPRRSGLYFNAARPGNGLVNFFRNTGPLAPGGQPQFDRFEELSGGWYTALADRTPVWFTMQSELVEGTGEVTLRKFSNPAAPDGFAPQGEFVGRAWLGRLATDRVGFAWRLNDGSSGIEMMRTSEFEQGGANHTQTWFNPAESGWGLAIETLYAGQPFEFVGAFIYDSTGAPRWVTGAVNSFSGGQIDLNGHRPHCPACPWIVDWSSDAVAAGSLQLRYEENQQRASLDTAISLPLPYTGSWNRTDLEIEPISPPVPVP